MQLLIVLALVGIVVNIYGELPPLKFIAVCILVALLTAYVRADERSKKEI